MAMNAETPTRWQTMKPRIGSGYPLTIQLLVSLLLSILPIAVLSDATSSGRAFSLMQMLSFVGLVLLSLALFHCVPIVRLKLWKQLCMVGLQCALISTMQAIIPSTLIGYLFIAPLIQSVYLFRVWIWLPLAIGMWLTLGGTSLIATQGWIEWIGANIYMSCLLVGVAVAAAVYTYQHRMRTQIEHTVQKLQQQYHSAKQALEEVTHKATLEERDRLDDTVHSDLRMALGQLEQMVGNAITQARNSVASTQPLVLQSQNYVRETVTTMRQALNVLRPGPNQIVQVDKESHENVLQLPLDHGLASPSVRHVLDWLPLIIGSLVPLWAIIEQEASQLLYVELGIIWLALLGYYLYTQFRSNSAWYNLGLVGQTCSLLLMLALTQSTALLIGLAMVAWQIALRSTWSQMVAGFAALQVAVTLVIGSITPAIWQTATNLLLFLLTGMALAVPIIIARRRYNQRVVAKQMVSTMYSSVARLHEQAATLRQQAVLAERHRIAREIHDGIGHYLMSISLQLHNAHEELSNNPAEALRQLEETQSLIVEAQRQLIYSFDALNPLPDETDALRKALEELVRSHNQHDQVSIKLEIDGDLASLSTEINLALYRVIQEGISNAIRHGQANEIIIRVWRRPHQVELSIQDNGRGPTGETTSGGLGLLGIKERAALLGGLCTSTMPPEGGFILYFEVPLTEATLS